MPDQPEAPQTLTLRERNKLRTRRELLDAALEVFAQSGYGSASVEAIAAKAGAAKATLYTYFPQGREEMFREIYEEVNGRLLDEGQRVYAQQEGTYVTRILALTRALVDVANTPLIGRFYSIDDPALDAALEPVRGHASRVWGGLIASDLEKARETGDVARDVDPHCVAALLVGAMRSALSDVSSARGTPEGVVGAFQALVRGL